MAFNGFLAVGMSVLLTGLLHSESFAVGVAVSAVNYTDEEMNYVAIDPINRGNIAADVVGPYSAGGIMCCYDLPKKWKPGIKLSVQFFDIKGKLIRAVTTDLLPYVDGKAEHLWIASYPDGNVEAVSSKYELSHPRWPGRVKGWPTPSHDFEVQLWQQKYDLAFGEVENSNMLLKKLHDDPQKQLKVAWEHDKEYMKKEVSRFSSAHDPAYKIYLEKRYQDGLASSLQEFHRIESLKP